MKTIILIASFITIFGLINVTAQNNWYKCQFNSIDSLLKIGLPGEAIQRYDSVYNKASDEKNSEMLIKSLMGRNGFLFLIDEDPYITMVDRLQKDILHYDAPLKQIANSLLAEMYWGYYKKNRWKFHNRTKVDNPINNDIRTWDLTRLASEMIHQLNLSLKNEEVLQNTSLNNFSSLLIGDSTLRYLRPSLYDILAHRALNMLMNQEINVTKPADAFTLNDNRFFAVAPEFVQSTLTTTDTLSPKFQCLNIFLKLTQYRLTNANLEALVDLEINRINYLHENSSNPDKDSLTIAFLEKLEKQNIPDESKAEVLYQQANFYFNQQDVDEYNKLKKSLDICNKAISDFPSSEAVEYIETLKDEIKKPELNITAEGIETPGKPFRTLLTWKNLGKAYYTVYKLSSSEKNSFDYQWRFEYDSIAKSEIVKKWEQPLPGKNSLVNHSAEIPVNGIPNGFYMVVVSDSANISDSKCRSAVIIQVSTLSAMSRNIPDGKLFVVSNAVNGRPVKGASIEVFKRSENTSSRIPPFEKLLVAKTNNKGEVTINLSENEYYMFHIINKNDTLILNNIYYYNYNPYVEDYEDQYRITFYTDRAIYRPGQTVHFKGIVLVNNKNQWNIVDNFKQTINLLNVNGEEVASLPVTSNEYGTFSGSFILPKSGLNGTYTIECEEEEGEQYIRVEDYRRPEFEVLFSQPDRSYSFDDSVKIHGSVMAFSGAPVDGATINYTVNRREQPLWWRWHNLLPDKIIASGTTTTAADGTFIIPFFTDSKDIEDQRRIMVYTVNITATDSKGETHTNEFALKISKTNILLNCDLPDKIIADQFSGAKISTTNLNGEAVKATVTLKVTRLNAPEMLLSDRYWSVPDTYVIEEKRFKRKFPKYPYRQEQLTQNWECGDVVLKQTINLPVSDQIKCTEWLNSKPGYYLVECEAISPDGLQTAYWSKTVRLLTPIPDKAPKTDDWVTPVKTLCEPGDIAEIWLTALHPKSPIRFELIKGSELLMSKIIVPGNKVYRLSIPVEEAYRGNITARFTHVANNRTYCSQVEIEVPFTNKTIDIAFTTFRDKLLPGEKELWGLTLKDKSGKGLLAEMVASLYDASLDQFAKLNWQTDFFTKSYDFYQLWELTHIPATGKNLSYSGINLGSHTWFKDYEVLPLLTSFQQRMGYSNEEQMLLGKSESLSEVVVIRGVASQSKRETTGAVSSVSYENMMPEALQGYVAGIDVREDSIPRKGGDGSLLEKKDNPDLSDVKLRTNFNETAFFYPNLYSDNNGNLEVSFTMPEAITRWRMLGFAHTKDLKLGTIEKDLITRKLVSISAYCPRFLREGDSLEIIAKVTNLTGDSLNGIASLQWVNAVTLEPVTAQLIQGDSMKTFHANAKASAVISWHIIVPSNLQALTYKVLAKANTHSDGEQKTIPVLSNRQLVTESMPFMVRGGENKSLVFDKMANNSSSTLENKSYTIEYTSNPVWYAIQALPYLMEYPYECAEQVFSRLYANATASMLVNSSPVIKATFDSWKNVDTGTFLSNLEKNDELKSVLLQESPWLIDAKNESETKKRIGLLFDLNRMGNEFSAAYNKLKEMQSPKGGFPWFKGMPDNQFITLHIVKGMAELKKMGCVNETYETEWENLRQNALKYLDNVIVENYKELLKQKEKDSALFYKYKPNLLQLHYLYSRSFYPNEKLTGIADTAFNYFFDQAKANWLAYSEYAQAMLAITCNRFNDSKIAVRIMKSLSDRAIRSKNEGMFWKNNRAGYFWYQAPVETQSLIMNAYSEITNDTTTIEELKIWLLRNKQTTHWKTTKATLAACYALLNNGYNLLGENRPIQVKLNGQALDNLKKLNPEAGTGYVKATFPAAEMKPEMAKVNVVNTNRSIAWGAAYWQYFEQLDKITSAKTDVEIRKQLYVKKKSLSGTVLKDITPGSPVHIGDEVVVRIEIHSLRDMEYVHLKDLRAAAFEPTETISGYRWQDGLGYYQEIKDVAANFFIGYLKKGTYVFEYSLRASQSGEFSNGITSLQCMYAPEFTTHSDGKRISVLKIDN